MAAAGPGIERKIRHDATVLAPVVKTLKNKMIDYYGDLAYNFYSLIEPEHEAIINLIQENSPLCTILGINLRENTVVERAPELDELLLSLEQNSFINSLAYTPIFLRAGLSDFERAAILRREQQSLVTMAQYIARFPHKIKNFSIHNPYTDLDGSLGPDLSLDENMFTTLFSMSITPNIPGNTHGLRTLSIHNVKLTLNGMQLLNEALQNSNSSLEHLDLESLSCPENKAQNEIKQSALFEKGLSRTLNRLSISDLCQKTLPYLSSLQAILPEKTCSLGAISLSDRFKKTQLQSLVMALGSNASLYSIFLSINKPTKDAAESIEDDISNVAVEQLINPLFTSSFVMASDNDHFCRTLGSLPGSQCLSAFGFVLQETLRPSSLNTLARIIPRTKLQELMIVQPRLGDLNCLDSMKPLFEALKDNPSLTKLMLSSSEPPRSAEELKQGGELKRAEETKAALERDLSFLYYLSQNHTLTSLDLSYNNLEASHIEPLISVLMHPKTALKILKLNDNPIGMAGHYMLANALQVNSSLRVLILNHHEEIKPKAEAPESLHALISALEANCTLTDLSFQRRKPSMLLSMQKEFEHLFKLTFLCARNETLQKRVDLNWARLAILISFLRAHASHPLRYSIIFLIPGIIKTMGFPIMEDSSNYNGSSNPNPFCPDRINPFIRKEQDEYAEQIEATEPRNWRTWTPALAHRAQAMRALLPQVHPRDLTRKLITTPEEAHDVLAKSKMNDSYCKDRKSQKEGTALLFGPGPGPAVNGSVREFGPGPGPGPAPSPAPAPAVAPAPATPAAPPPPSKK